MKADQKMTRADAIAVAIHAGLSILTGYFTVAAPALAARGIIGIAIMLFAPFLGGGAFLFLLFGAFRYSKKMGLKSDTAAMLLGIPLFSAIATLFLFAFQDRGAQFLETFANRIKKEVGVGPIQEFVRSVEMDTTKKPSFRGSDLPPQIRKLYRWRDARAHVTRTSEGRVVRIIIHWGAALWDWGVEIHKGEQPLGGIPKSREIELQEGIICFIAR